ncbi:GNAT family N-acetyltransferase [Paralcaligenes ginsengisoli]|jgi:ribosomal protein S18 acetylase RimI-like enzyme
MMEIREANTPEEIRAAAVLFEEYAASLDIDLAFQDFAAEVALLPGAYAPPSGALLLAWDGDVTLGCVALRPFEPPAIAELKRLYVRPAGRGRAVGSRLSQAAIARAKQLGYERVRLDTLPSMLAAQRLYGSLGFHEIAPYRFNPVEGTRYMELLLQELQPPQ